MSRMPDNYIGIDEDRLKHVRAVGARASELAAELFGWDEQKCRDMFVLGYLHDVGYQYAPDQLQHEEIGGEILKHAGYRYWAEVYYHGVPNSPYRSDELFILNVADMETSKDGQRVTMNDRLNDIKQRYGDTSKQFIKADTLMRELQERIRQLLEAGN